MRQMDIEQYLSERQKRLDKSKEQIRNFGVFDFNYIPEKPLMREEVKPIIDALLRYQQTGIANNVLILGSRGSGKSVFAKYLMKILSEQGQLDFGYANCRQHNTSFKILAFLLGLRPRGCSLDELWQKFTDSRQGKIVFVLDEIDLMSDKDKHKDILYLISRSKNNYMAILLSNNPKFLTPLDESIKSTLQPEIVHFRSYNAIEIEKILTDRAKVGLNSLMEITFREIREFGESLIILDQHPSQISLPALGNTYCTIAMNQKHKSDINALSQCMLLDKDKDLLGQLRVGQAIVKLQGRIARPFQIKVPEFIVKKGEIADNYIKEHMQHIAPSLPDQDFPAVEAVVNSMAMENSDNEIAFLKDVQKYPESGIAARYKRLELSVRQGQKLKTKLFENELIEEHQETTKTGRLRVIRLAEKGNALLSKVE